MAGTWNQLLRAPDMHIRMMLLDIYFELVWQFCDAATLVLCPARYRYELAVSNACSEKSDSQNYVFGSCLP